MSNIDIASENGDFSVITFWTIDNNTPIIHKSTLREGGIFYAKDWYNKMIQAKISSLAVSPPPPFAK